MILSPRLLHTTFIRHVSYLPADCTLCIKMNAAALKNLWGGRVIFQPSYSLRAHSTILLVADRNIDGRGTDKNVNECFDYWP